MENITALPIVSDCMIYEHEPLWIVVMVVMSAISTLIAMFVRKRRARASAHTTSGVPLPLSHLGGGEEMV